MRIELRLELYDAMSCKWARDLACRHPQIGGDATPEKCAVCPRYAGRVRGLGDVVHAVTTATGIAAGARALERITGTPCGCAARRAALNAAVPSDAKSE